MNFANVATNAFELADDTFRELGESANTPLRIKEQPMTLYRALYGERGLWVRPAAMFNEDVVIAGVRQPRFTWVGEIGAAEP